MSLEELHKELNSINALRENRIKFAEIVLNDLSLLPKLITIVFRTDDKVSCKAAWMLEFVCNEYIYSIIPYLDEFTSNLHKIQYDSAIRSVAKICEFLAKANYLKQPNTMSKMLSPKHKEHIIESCFDWMIRDEKTAVKVYAMNTLCLFGKDYKWIHPELAQILEQNYQNESAGFKARAKHILKRIKVKN